jgi:hypothetical protein
MTPSASGERQGDSSVPMALLSCACGFPRFRGHCTDAEARTDVDPCINADARTCDHADAFLPPFMLFCVYFTSSLLI